jgi:ADP-dependent NAD(P)H-hydrate dehydratase / NAD(P)H-hydrate epimerase
MDAGRIGGDGEMRVATAAQTRRLEEAAVAAGATWPGLMAGAGLGMARIALDMLGDGRGSALVVAGPGNNGGDGLVIARHLHDAGMPVLVYLWSRAAREDDWPLRDVRERGIVEIRANDDPEQLALRRELPRTALVVDALLGTGLTRPLDATLCMIVAAVNQAGRPVLAVDIPTGIQSDTGAIMGCAVRATRTAAAGILKPGHLFAPGADYAGPVEVIDIGLPDRLEDEQMTAELTAETMRALLPARPADSHKGTFGKAMIVGGNGRYPGAPFLAASGALRSGAGLVTLAVGRSLFGPLAAALHEATFLPLAEEEWGTIGGAAAADLSQEMSGYDAVVLGPGLGREDPTKTFLLRLLKLETAKPATGVGFVRASTTPREARRTGGVGFARTPVAAKEPERAAEAADENTNNTLILDADALNILSEIEDWHERLPSQNAILTPHPGEMARLLGLDGAADVNRDRLAHARDAAARWKQVVVLKGAGTVIAASDGRTAIGPAGNPALASGGTGDVLAGLIGGLAAQGLGPYEAACLGVFLHAEAGRLVRAEVGEAGAVAGDLLQRLPRAITLLREPR